MDVQADLTVNVSVTVHATLNTGSDFDRHVNSDITWEQTLKGCQWSDSLVFAGIDTKLQDTFWHIDRDVIKFWKLVAHLGQWLTTLGALDLILLAQN